MPDNARMHESAPYTCRVEPVQTLDETTLSAMTALYLSAYDATNEALFRSDLADKDEVLLLRCGRELVGFTTLRSFPFRWRDESLQVVFSGDTIVDPRHWGQTALSFAWVRHMAVLKQRRPDHRLVWWLLVKGHRTYRYLDVFARHYHPRAGHPDTALAELADALASAAFPGQFQPHTGVVAFEPSRGQLKPALAEPRPEELARAPVRFFLERNPGFRAGHELVCLCDMEPANMKPLTLRLFRSAQSPIPAT